ncbi:hypothetical protein AMS68_002757 [Peltaster fructicola]|uniref:Septin-type G domain-containing protein n=1 Tax=Peltaster fructicola TaxID=286661 RepID=A0A6H0XRZ3_9PEZI|nr:hypothetical protein AMS68_002757 [Peltaster fructicola]
MSASDLENRTLKAKRAINQHGPAPTGPMTFFLRTEAELDKSVQESDDKEHGLEPSTADTSYGVQSLEDTMNDIPDTMSSLVQISSNEGMTGNSVLAGRKRKPGNPVHPKIFATGQRIVSSERSSSPSGPQSVSPLRSRTRRTSLGSGAHFTPLNMSPHPSATAHGTPSVKSFRLSDEEASVVSDSGSQVIQSSSSDDDVEVRIPPAMLSPPPQLVMPSISMPQRRPFTQRGRNMGQMRVMTVGGSGLGKTSLIRNMFRLCEDIVHIDGITSSTASLSTATSNNSSILPTATITELHASTKPVPTWWSDVRDGRSWWRRKSFTDGVLERNLRFVDTPGVNSNAEALQILKEVDTWYRHGMQLDNLTDSQLLALLSGRGDSHLDAVLYLFEPEDKHVSEVELQLIAELSQRTNLVPLIARCDLVDAEALEARKAALLQTLISANIDICSLTAVDTSQDLPTLHAHDIYAISSLADDGDIMDASTLMASSYIPPLHASDLKLFVDALFQPGTIERLRHQSTVKFLAWRRRQLGRTTSPQMLDIPSSDKHTTSTESILEDPSKVLVPHGYSSYFRSTSPSSDASEPLFARPYTLPQHHAVAEPSRHIHVAKWARDLRWSLRKESDQDDQVTRPLKGRIGGDLAIIDPKDPLGILSLTQAFGRRGWFALQVVSGCGLLSAAVWYVARNWIQWQTWFWPGQEGYFAPLAVPAPTRSWLDTVRMV